MTASSRLKNLFTPAFLTVFILLSSVSEAFACVDLRTGLEYFMAKLPDYACIAIVLLGLFSIKKATNTIKAKTGPNNKDLKLILVGLICLFLPMIYIFYITSHTAPIVETLQAGYITGVALMCAGLIRLYISRHAKYSDQVRKHKVLTIGWHVTTVFVVLTIIIYLLSGWVSRSACGGGLANQEAFNKFEKELLSKMDANNPVQTVNQ